MNVSAKYTTNLAKAQGMVPETYELLQLWTPGMSVAALKTKVREVGALGRATQVRVDDIVGRAFAQRYLCAGTKPAIWLKRLLDDQAPRPLLRQLMFLFTARANRVLHDFVCDVYWRKCNAGAGEVTKQDAHNFLTRAMSTGHVDKRWSDTMIERVTRYLLGTLEDFEMIEDNRFGRRKLRPPVILPQAVLFLVYELHFAGLESVAIPKHEDWGLFGLMPADVLGSLEAAAAQGHLLFQNSGAILRIEWTHSDMESVLDALTHRKI